MENSSNEKMSHQGQFRRHLHYLAGKSVRSDEVGGLLDIFIILAVLTIVVVRFFLWLTGYPQIGGSTLHIAHMLWGGLLMLIALILEQSIILKWARRLGAILGGIGFGLFIDELGKFITQDNDYFFKPTYALIYLIFILIYFITRSLLRSKPLSSTESLINALDYLKETAAGDLDDQDKTIAVKHLDQVSDQNPLKTPLKNMFEQIATLPTRPLFIWETVSQRARRFYLKIISTKTFTKFIVFFFIAVGLYGFLKLRWEIRNVFELEKFQLTDWALLLSSCFTFLFIILGDIQLFKKNRLAAYKWFERALLIAILFGQVFVFYHIQLPGIIWFVFLLFLLMGIRLMIHHETSTKF